MQTEGSAAGGAPQLAEHLGGVSPQRGLYWPRPLAANEGNGDRTESRHGLVSTAITSVSLVARGVQSSLDLCGAILYDLGGGKVSAREKDLAEVQQLVDSGALQLTSREATWLEQLAEPQLALLKETRDSLTHRTLSQSARIGVGSPAGK